jgi:serine phosphatase RsbU (regulator of sigma subunit)
MSEGSRKLLIIDDDTIVRQSVVAYLEDSGFSVMDAADGVLGLYLFRETIPDLVITDLRMPGMDGLQVLDQVHTISPETPVIVVSGAGVMGDVVEALRLGAADYLIKPLADMEVLVHAVRKSLERLDLLAENRRYREEMETANRELRDHLRTLEKDQEAGRHVQQRLLPPSPINKHGYHIEHRIIPSLYLSGDTIDLAYVKGRYIPFHLTDVSGHGASSAFVTVWLKHLSTDAVMHGDMYATEQSASESPNVFLDMINNQLNESRLGNHMTCFTGTIDTETHKLRYSVGGHLPMPMMIMDGRAEYLEGRGKPLGIFRDVSWDIYEVDFPPGATLVSFSDGILEVLPPKDLLEKEAYLLDVLSGTDGSVAAISEVLGLDAIEEAPDDIAVLAITRPIGRE